MIKFGVARQSFANTTSDLKDRHSSTPILGDRHLIAWLTSDLRMKKCCQMFIEVVKAGSAQAASNAENVTLATVYNRLRRLETVFNSPLLMRRDGLLVPTETGTHLLNWIHSADDSFSIVNDNPMKKEDSLSFSSPETTKLQLFRKDSISNSVEVPERASDNKSKEWNSDFYDNRYLPSPQFSTLLLNPTHKNFYQQWLFARAQTNRTPNLWALIDKNTANEEHAFIAAIRILSSGEYRIIYANTQLRDLYRISHLPADYMQIMNDRAVDIRSSLLNTCVLTGRPMRFISALPNRAYLGERFSYLLLPVTTESVEAADTVWCETLLMVVVPSLAEDTLLSTQPHNQTDFYTIDSINMSWD